MKLKTLLLLISASPAFAGEVSFLDPTNFSDADVIIIGENHDQAAHHLTQAAVIALMDPKAVVFEMLTADQAALVTPDTEVADLDTLLEWSESGWPEFDIYAPIFASLGDAAIIGAAPAADRVEMARADGAAAAIDDPVFALNEPLSPDEQAAREAGMQDNHCGALPDEMLPWFVDQQRFADAAFTQATLDALETYGAPVIVITGNGHARTDWGMPVYLRRAAPDVAVLSMGQLTAPQPAPPYDMWMITESVTSGPDPCAAFQ